ncbi:MAG TPA: DUF2157 domain-containing protein [Marinobacter sp.]|nr:DUF2157 domain-containing protein [Marinobacter sp.]
MLEIRSETRKAFVSLVDGGHIAPADAHRAAAVAGVFPAGSQWLRFLDVLLLCLGGLALAFSVLLFVAFNWSELGRLARFALVEGAVLLAFVGYCLAGRDSLAGKVALLATGLLLGGLLALFGQTYQTGADPWQLFFVWMLLLTPFALMGRFAPLWVLWAVLVNFALTLYFQPTGRFSTEAYGQLLWVQFSANGLMWCAWEWLAGRTPWLNQRWALRLLAMATLMPLTLRVVEGVFSDGDLRFPVLVGLLAVAIVYRVYRYQRQDLFMLTLGVVSVISVVVSLLVKHVLWHLDNSVGVLLMAIALMAMSTLAVNWLRSVHRRWQV